MSQLPDYVASAQPNPFSNRVGWLTSTAASYAGVMLWFAFWQDVPKGGDNLLGGTLIGGLGLAISALVFAAFMCYILCYIVPGMLGMKTGLSLTVVGTSTYGVKGGYFMPGFLMGALQFGWLSVNAYFAGLLLTSIIMGEEVLIVGGAPLLSNLGMMRAGLGVAWIVLATFVGMKGVQYVGKVASFTPILPIGVLLFLLFSTIGGVKEFEPSKLDEGALIAQAEWAKKAEAAPDDIVVQKAKADADKFADRDTGAKHAVLYRSETLGVFSVICAYVVGFFATAGAAGVGFGANNKNQEGVYLAGFVGIVLTTIFTGSIALLAVAGAQSTLPPELAATYNVPALFGAIFNNPTTAKVCMLLLVLAAFPSACFPAVVAADAFKTTFPKINPLITAGLGVLVAIGLVVSSWAGQAATVFGIVGASFGPICGAMAADYILAGKRWAGPREGFNLPGWISWFFGFLVGGLPLIPGLKLPFDVPCPPVAAILTGFVLYWLLAKMGMESKVMDMPQRIDLDDDVRVETAVVE